MSKDRFPCSVCAKFYDVVCFAIKVRDVCSILVGAVRTDSVRNAAQWVEIDLRGVLLFQCICTILRNYLIHFLEFWSRREKMGAHTYQENELCSILMATFWWREICFNLSHHWKKITKLFLGSQMGQNLEIWFWKENYSKITPVFQIKLFLRMINVWNRNLASKIIWTHCGSDLLNEKLQR